MTRETKRIDLGLGYQADIITYFTQGERRMIDRVFADTAIVGHVIEKRTENGQQVERSMERLMTGGNYFIEAQNAWIKAAVLAVLKDSSELQGSIVDLVLDMPEVCFKNLKLEVEKLTPTEDEKKEGTTPTTA